MTAPRTVAVFGSCITRDNFNSEFNPGHRRWYSVSAAANQSSVIALMSPPIEPEVTEADGLDDYNAWNVRSDLSRSFLGEVAEARPDYLILDFFGDLHFGVLQLQDGRYATDNRWKLHATAQYRSWHDTGVVVGTESWRADPEAYFARWTGAMERFAAFIAEHCPDTTVIVHRGFYADRVVTGPTGAPQPLRKHARLAKLDARATNAFWARLDEHATETYGWTSIDLRGEQYTSTTQHKWGPFWVHYTAEYYHRFLAELHLIDLGRRGPEDLVAAVEVVGSSGRDRLAQQAPAVVATNRAQRARIRELEGLGVLSAGRAALGRRRTAQAGPR